MAFILLSNYLMGYKNLRLHKHWMTFQMNVFKSLFILFEIIVMLYFIDISQHLIMFPFFSAS